jgi:hypothetical protein
VGRWIAPLNGALTPQRGARYLGNEFRNHSIMESIADEQLLP